MIKNIALLIITTLFTLLIVEGILRLFYSEYFYSGSSRRSLYYSSPNLELTKDHQSVHYAPNNNIRSITVYYNKIEYDTKHHSNNYGFLSEQDYKKDDSKSGVIFLGDSFTAGVGATKPWIPELNKKYSSINLYSLGVTGTGIWNFYNTLSSYKDRLNFDTIVILSISDDLRRLKWYPHQKSGTLYFCFKNNEKSRCTLDQPIAKIINYNIDSATLLKPEGLYIVKAYDILKKMFGNFIKKEEIKIPKKRVIPNNLNYDKEYLVKIKKLSEEMNKKLIFIHLPEKAEVEAGYYRCNLEDYMKKIGIEYHPILYKYKFNMSMYHKHDGHPNNKGYSYISSIVEDILTLNIYP